jgi:hypothetical protein
VTVVFLHSRASASIINFSIISLFLIYVYICIFYICICKYNIGTFDTTFVCIVLAINDK